MFDCCSLEFIRMVSAIIALAVTAFVAGISMYAGWMTMSWVMVKMAKFLDKSNTL